MRYLTHIVQKLVFKKWLFCIWMLAGSKALAQPGYWQQQLHYTIDVSLNDKEHTLDGFLKLQYSNHSPDTLTFIWFHLWPNAFKNDRTAFSEQSLQNGDTKFYFSDKDKRGYINRLDFRISNATLRVEDHPLYIDVVKVYLPEPLAPGAQTEITTPFHVKLPANFSRGGHTGRSYQVTQWYPKPAVYDRKGWHPMPYLDQGEFYSEFGSYDVRITLPEDYVVAATGIGDTKPETGNPRLNASVGQAKSGIRNRQPATGIRQPVTSNTKTLQFKQDNIHDFAWFADKKYTVLHDTIQLASGRVVDAYSYYRSKDNEGWKNSMQYIKDAIHFRSRLIGEYPYDVVSVVEASMGFEGGMEYPTITNISTMQDAKTLDMIIGHEIGHNWFYGILASNERDHPWMDEGINTYYDKRYEAWKYPRTTNNAWIKKRLPDDMAKMTVDALAKKKEDQPIATASAEFTDQNYGYIAYYKTAFWLQDMEQYVGREQFDACIQAYYRQWQFKHPYPEDFQQAMQQHVDKDLSHFFEQLHQSGPATTYSGPKKIKPAFIFSWKDYERVNYINLTPVPGYNKYDGVMLGLAVHNISPYPANFQYLLIPLYATNSKKLNGLGALSYTWYPGGRFHKIDIGVSGGRFSSLSGVDSNGNKVFGGFYKIAPSLRLTFKNEHPRSTLEKWLEWKTFFIGERGFTYHLDSDDMEYYPAEGKVENRYLNQLTYNIADYRALYPYDAQLQVQQGDGFYRATATGHYYFNYAKGGGMQVRAFAAKFGYLGQRTTAKEFATAVYQPKLTAVRGYEDYTYSNYFFGRNEFEGFASQQIMMRDGGLKLRTDLFQGLQGRSDDWVASLNFNTTLPDKLFPVKLPIRIFLDLGTYAEAWKKEAETGRFLYVAGLQLSLFKDLINVYAPVLYSKEFRDNLKTVPEENTFFKKLSFSIDIHRFNWRRIYSR